MTAAGNGTLLLAGPHFLGDENLCTITASYRIKLRHTSFDGDERPGVVEVGTAW